MIRNLVSCLCFIVLININLGEKLSFNNYTVFKIYPKNNDQIKVLQNLLKTNNKFDFWNDPVESSDFVNIMASPEGKGELQKFLTENNLNTDVGISNVQELINKETIGKYTRNNLKSMQWNAYYSLDDIYAWLDDLNTTYPDIVSPLVGGETYEGRLIKGIKISHGSGKRAIFLEGGIHSREWISPVTVNYITEQLLVSNDPETVAAARNYDWYIFPVTNPDGYIWTHESNRMWRKNRRPIDTNIGVDLNRNWDNNWMVAGVSNNSAFDNYAGTAPFSEPETRTLSVFISSIADDLDMYISFHSFSQMLLLPFGNSTQPLANYEEAMNIGRRAMGALSVKYGTEYVTGNIAETIYEATGGSVDWVKEHHKVPLVYCYELRDTGNYGFILPTDQILPNNLEVMDSVLDLIHQAERFGVMNSGVRVTISLVYILLISILVFNFV